MKRSLFHLAPVLCLGIGLIFGLSCTPRGGNSQGEALQSPDGGANPAVENSEQPTAHTKPYDKLELINSIWDLSNVDRAFRENPFALIYEIDLDKDGLNELYIELGAKSTANRLYALCAMGDGKLEEVTSTSSPYGERITLYEGGGVSRSWYSGGSGETPDTYILIQGSQAAVMLEGDVSIEYNDSLQRPMISGAGRNMVTGEEMAIPQVHALDPAFRHQIKLDSAQAITVML